MMNEIDKEHLILVIKNRIRSEHGKYSKYQEMDWMEIAARKILAEVEIEISKNLKNG